MYRFLCDEPFLAYLLAKKERTYAFEITMLLVWSPAFGPVERFSFSFF
jgi:hypothetical protein